MYCFTYASNFKCIENELILWSDISSEHPTFIKTVAKLTKKRLSESTVNKLTEVTKRFSELNRQVKALSSHPQTNYYNMYKELERLVNQFLIDDKYVLGVLPEVKAYGKDDKVWQTLLEHITHEQNFMYELFSNLQRQLKRMSVGNY